MANANSESHGILYVVATPIGNLADLGARAAEVLGRVDLIAAEDTRRAGRLLVHLGVQRELLPLHEHNEADQSAKLLRLLEGGGAVALISDAGTPLISDPGLKLVAAANAIGIRVVSVPGPSAVTAALSVSGLPTDRFVFEGFLPRRSARRRERLAEMAAEPRTIVFFEAVHRVEATLADMVAIFGGERRATLARELTKLHEQVLTASLAELGAALGDEVPLRGEFVLVVAGAAGNPGADDDEVRRIYALLAAALPPADAVALCAKIRM